ncbi:methionyl-tRNA formyltransferase [Mycoplasma sp. Ms02]|uniref:methionyl-tRNA formyltransferase n=1 Tax=Mycoplasma sp. Ms02 TaxID=353851 RepID=UPI00351CB862
MESKIKILLAGTPEFSVPVFEEVIQNFEVVGIVSQPDRPSNRGYKTTPTPVKLLAQKYEIPLYQPNKIGEIYEELSFLEFDYLLTCAFGQYIPTKVLDLPKIASINVHGSLLPKYRGAAPIQYSLYNGDKETGITLIYMTKEMDAGDMIASAKIPILEEDTSDSLFIKMSHLAKENIVGWIKNHYDNIRNDQKQDSTQVVLSPKLLKEDALIKDTDSKEHNFNKIRAFSSNPGAYTFVNGKRLKVFYAKKELVKNAPIIQCSDGSLYATDYQFESKKRVKIA